MCCCCTQGTPAHVPAEVLVKRRKRVRGASETWEIVRARGHLDEVQELRSAAPQSADPCLPELSPRHATIAANRAWKLGALIAGAWHSLTAFFAVQMRSKDPRLY